ncbi:relaxase [Vibrio astriarenae]|nr:relaxase [Vibrio sp. C7]
MRLSWQETKVYLEQHYLAQKGRAPTTEAAPNVIRSAWGAQLHSERTERQTYLAQYRQEKKAIYEDVSLTKPERQVALSIAQMNKVIHDMQFKQRSRQARAQLNAQDYSSYQQGNPIMREEMGKVIDHQSAPYQHNPKNKQSYCVTLSVTGNNRKCGAVS